MVNRARAISRVLESREGCVSGVFEIEQLSECFKRRERYMFLSFVLIILCYVF